MLLPDSISALLVSVCLNAAAVVVLHMLLDKELERDKLLHSRLDNAFNLDVIWSWMKLKIERKVVEYEVDEENGKRIDRWGQNDRKKRENGRKRIKKKVEENIIKKE